MTDDSDQNKQDGSHDASRRRFLKGVGIAGAGAALADSLLISAEAKEAQTAAGQPVSGDLNVALKINGQRRTVKIEPRRASALDSHGTALGRRVEVTASPDGYVIQRDKEVAKNEPGPHNGGGPSTGYVFFEKVPDLKFSFRKRVLHRGAAIGYHVQETDEVYYILGGNGKMTINGNVFPVKAGDAMLTRAGSSHGLVQTGAGDLTIIITYQK